MRRWTWIVAMALVLVAGAPRVAAQGGHEHGAPQPAGPAPTAGAGPVVHLTVATDPTPAQARQPVDLVLALHDAATGAPLTDLSVEHARLLHLVVVSEDLATFDHLHPLPVDDGVFRLTHTFPTGGRYRLYVEFTSRALGPLTLTAALEVDGTAPPPGPMVPGRQEVDASGAWVRLVLDPLVPRAGQPTRLRFELSQAGQPVVDLQPFLGVAGHLVALSQDLQRFTHAHPSDAGAGDAAGDHAAHGPSGAGERFGPTVEFTVTFPQPGLYKLWAQFNRDGEAITAPFVVQVAP